MTGPDTEAVDAITGLAETLDILVQTMTTLTVQNGQVQAACDMTLLLDLEHDTVTLAGLLAVALGRLSTAALAGPAPAAGPQEADPVWIGEPLPGVEMHRTVDSGRRTGCDRPAYGGRITTAANARQRWQARTCPRCWPGAAS